MRSTLKSAARLFSALALVGLVAACGSGDRTSPGVEASKSVRALLKAKAASKKQPQLAPGQLAALALSKVQGPLILAITDRTKETAVLAEFAINGSYRTFTTPARQNVTFKRGLVSGTRGLGYDLLSARMDGSVALVTARREGSSQRVQNYASVEGPVHTVSMNCQVRRAGAESLAKPLGGSVQTMKMIEQCSGDGVSMANQYWVLSDGFVWQSVQWVGPDYGALILQTLRR